MYNRGTIGDKHGGHATRRTIPLVALVALLAACGGTTPTAAPFPTVPPSPTFLQAHRRGHLAACRRVGDPRHRRRDTLGHLLTLRVTAANEQERAQVGDLAEAVQAATGETVQLAFVDQGYTGAATTAAAHGIRLGVVKLPEAKRGLVPSPPGTRRCG